MAAIDRREGAHVAEDQDAAPDHDLIRRQLRKHRVKMKLSLRICVHCSLCAESCFIYTTRGRKPEYMPSHKVIHSVGVLYKRKGKVDRADLEEISKIVWERCVLCMRCYCPFGIDIPGMIAFARGICRSQKVLPAFDEE